MSTVVTRTIGDARSEVAWHRSLFIETILAGALAGVFYSLSPSTVWLSVVVALLIRWAAHGLPADERRWVVRLLFLSVLLRATVIVIIAWRNDPTHQSFSTIFGDASYAIRMSLWIRNTYVGLPIEPRDFLEAFDIDYGRTSYHTMLAAMQVFLGPAPYGVHLLSAVLYLVGVVAMYRVARRSFGPLAAFVGLSATVFMPSLFLWSILPLKESVYFFCMAIAISAVVALFRTRTWTGRGVALVLTAGSLAAIGSLRAGGLVIAVGGLLVGLAAALAARWRLVLLSLLILAPFGAARIFSRPAVHEQMLTAMQDSVARHLGHVATPGSSYRLLDDQTFYRGEKERDYHTLSFDEGVRFVARSIVAFVLIPKPWDPSTRGDIFMAPQQITWYILFVFALVGVVAGLRRDPLVTCLLAGNAIVGIIIIAPNSGNVGTLIRHRDMVVPFVVWLSGVGIVAALEAANRLRAAWPGTTSGKTGKSEWL